MADMIIATTSFPEKDGKSLVLHLNVYDTAKLERDLPTRMFEQTVIIPPFPLPIEMPEAISYTSGCLKVLAAALDKRMADAALAEANKSETDELF